MSLLALLLKRIGRYGKTPSERFHCPEMILESEGGSGRRRQLGNHAGALRFLFWKQRSLGRVVGPEDICCTITSICPWHCVRF